MDALGALEGEVGRWLASHGHDVHGAFDACRRGDWLVHIAIALEVERTIIVLAAAESARLALERTQQRDLRAARAVQTAIGWARGECPPADAWAAAFAASHAAEEIARENPLASEAARAAAAAAFACDPRADRSYYAQKAYAADAVEHAVRAYGLEERVGRQRCLDVVRERITLEVLLGAAGRPSSPPLTGPV